MNARQCQSHGIGIRGGGWAWKAVRCEVVETIMADDHLTGSIKGSPIQRPKVFRIIRIHGTGLSGVESGVKEWTQTVKRSGEPMTKIQ